MATVQDPNFNSSNTASAPPGQTDNFGQPINVSNNAASGPGGYKGGAAPASANGGQSSGNNSSGNTAATTNAPSSSGQYQNLQSYVNANQNYTNNGGLASQLSGDYNKQAQGAQNNITDASKNWYDTNSSADVDPTKAGQYVNNIVADPTTAANDPNSVSQFRNYLNAQNNYIAPTQFDPTQMYQQQVQNYNQSVGQLGTSNGRQAALQQMYNNPYYSQGQQSLDNLILGSGVNTNTGVNQLQQLQQNTQGYGQGLQNTYNNTANSINGTFDPKANTFAGGALQQYANDAQTTQANAQNTLNGGITGLYDQYASRLPDLEQQRNSAFDTTKNVLASNQLSPELAAQLGIDPTMQLYGVNAGADAQGNSFLTKNTMNPTVATTISAPDQAKMDAYAKLAGSYAPPDAAGTDLSALKGNTLANSWDNTPYTYNLAGLNSAVGNAKINMGNEIKSLENSAPPDLTSLLLNSFDYQNTDPVAYRNAILNGMNGLNGVPGYSLAPDVQKLGDGGATQYVYAPPGTSGVKAGMSGAETADQIGAQAGGMLTSLNNILAKYGVNPESGISQGFTNIPNAVGPIATTGPTIGQNNTPIPAHGGTNINPLTGLPMSYS